jgi:3-keto-L-gulonate-6-phosphate decarboxylase
MAQPVVVETKVADSATNGSESVAVAGTDVAVVLGLTV